MLKAFVSTQVDYNKNLIELLSNSNNMEDSNSILSLLKPGQLFSGEVTDIRGQMIQIYINNEQMVSAKLLDSADFVIGQTVTFQVKDKKDGVIMIHPILTDEATSLPMQKALTAAGLTITDKNLELVKTLMNEQQPIDKQTLTFYLKQRNTFPNADIKTLILMNKNNIPITSETIYALENYKNYEQGLLKEIDTLSNEIPNVILDTIKEKGVEAALELQDKIVQLFTKEPVESINGKGTEKNLLFSPKLREELALSLEKLEIPQELKQMVLSDKVPAELILKSLNEFLKDNTFPEQEKLIQTLFETDSYKELVKETLSKELLLEPKDLEVKGKIKEYYKDLLEKNQSLKSIFETVDKGNSKASQTVSDMNQNIRFMNNLNEVFSYIQLPLKLANQNAHGDLYVLRKKKKTNPEEDLTAMLHLDLENLGEVNVFVRLKGKLVNSTFTLDNNETAELIEKNLSLLTVGLNKKGYQLIASVKEENSKKDFVEKLLEQDSTNTSVKRYSFDVRA